MVVKKNEEETKKRDKKINQVSPNIG